MERTKQTHGRTEHLLDRLAMASDCERTLMAWGRTGLSQIGVGLALFVFLEAMKMHSKLALIIIALGTIASIVGIAEYVGTTKRLNRRYGTIPSPVPYQAVVAAMIAVFGIVVLLTLVVGYDIV